MLHAMQLCRWMDAGDAASHVARAGSVSNYEVIRMFIQRDTTKKGLSQAGPERRTVQGSGPTQPCSPQAVGAQWGRGVVGRREQRPPSRYQARVRQNGPLVAILP